VERLIQEMGIQAMSKRKYEDTTDSVHSKPVAENQINRDFTPKKPNTSWVADITYIPTAEGCLYLAIIMNLFFSAHNLTDPTSRPTSLLECQ